MGYDIKPIETVYKGYRFRSRLEARWAVFFDTLGIRYEYEPQGFQLPDGTWYLPDFCLHGFTGRGAEATDVLWAEVKGVTNWLDMEKFEAELQKAYLFSGSNADEVAKLNDERWEERGGFLSGPLSDNDYIKPTIPRPIIVLPSIPEDVCEWYAADVTGFEYVDGDVFACVISKAERKSWSSKFELCGADSSYIEGWQIEQTNRALERARSARFEHGETGPRRRIR